uniref:BRCA-2_OB1 domain-containing protein n=1 Tax=Mesocestoides corti TaxID=53468 RepID=A0A5K3FA68_MESCO
ENSHKLDSVLFHQNTTCLKSQSNSTRSIKQLIEEYTGEINSTDSQDVVNRMCKFKSGFTTGGGKPLDLVSVESIQRAKRLVDAVTRDLQLDESETHAESSNRLTNSPKSGGCDSTIEASSLSANPGAPTNDFSDISTSRPALTLDFIEKKDSAPDSSKSCPDKLLVTPSTGDRCGSTSGNSAIRLGFVSGHGKPLAPGSTESVERARRPVEECFKEPESGNSEACAGLNDQLTPAPITTGPPSMFTSGAGKPLNPVSDEALKRAKRLITECESEPEMPLKVAKLEPQVCRVEHSPEFGSPIVYDLSEASPTLNFDDSFEIPSQIANCADLAYPRSQGLEGERVAMRAEQERKAEACFKSTASTSCQTSSSPQPTPHRLLPDGKPRKVDRQPRMPGLLWRLRRASGVRPKPDSLTYCGHPPSRTDLKFAGDFLSLGDATVLSLKSAVGLRFKLDSESVSVSYLLGDDVDVIPDSQGYAGCAEIARAFVCSPGVTRGLASRQWIIHHYAQLAWRLSSVTLLHYEDILQNVFPRIALPNASVHRSDGAILLHVLLLELKYRYDRELEAAERPAIRKILERDDTPAKRIVLCVSHLEALPSQQYRGRLTDGWYHVDWVPDRLLTGLIQSGRIRVGTKLVTAGAELVQAPSGFGGDVAAATTSDADAHLFGESSSGLALRLHGNSTRPAPPNARLGYASHPPMAHLPPLPLSSLSTDGGFISCVCVLIQRRFQLQYMETCSPDGGSRQTRVFRDPRSERAAERLHANNCQVAFDRAVSDFTSPQGKRLRRSQPTTAFLASLGVDGEALWNAVTTSPDPDLAESGLSALQRDAMLRYKETALQDMVVQAVSKRDVTPLMRLHVAGIHSRDVDRKQEMLLTIWNPTDQMQDALQEGCVVQLTRLQVSCTRANDPFAYAMARGTGGGQLLCLSCGRSTSLRPLKPTEVIKLYQRGRPTGSMRVQEVIKRVYQPRVFLSIGRLKELAVGPSDRPKAVDFTALVVGSKTTSSSTTDSKSDLGVVYLASLRGSDGAEDFTTLGVLRIWGGLERYCLSSVLAEGNRVRFTDVQLRGGCGRFQLDRDFPPEGSSEVNIVSLTYSAASYVTFEGMPRDPTTRRFQTPWQETPQFRVFMQTCMESHFEQFFSGKPPSLLATPSVHQQQTSVETPPPPPPPPASHQSTPLRRSATTSGGRSISSLLRGGTGLFSPSAQLQTTTPISAPPSATAAAASTSSSRTRPRTGLSRPRRSAPLVETTTTSLTPKTPIKRPKSPSLAQSPVATTRPRSKPASPRTPLPQPRAKRPHCSRPKTPLSKAGGCRLSQQLHIKSPLPPSRRARSQPTTPKTPTTRAPCVGSPSTPKPKRPSAVAKAKPLVIPETQLDETSPGASQVCAEVEASSPLNVSIADLVKTRQRRRTTTVSLPYLTSRSLELKPHSKPAGEKC